MEIGPGRTIGGRYLIQQELGRGGFAVVYAATHMSLGSTHALKVLHTATPSLSQRLLTEGRAQAQLRHPNIVSVTDVVELDGSVVLVMEYIDGPTLADVLATRTLSWGEIDLIVRGLLHGVAAAHQKELVHRDLKPANVLMAASGPQVQPKITDFGLVKMLDGAAGALTLSGVSMGTPAYMAPEQFGSASKVDERSDIYSLGCIVYELCCGRRASIGDRVFEIAQVAETASRPAVSELSPDTPPRIAALIEQALSPDPAHRPASAAKMLEKWRAGSTSDADAHRTLGLLTESLKKELLGGIPVSGGMPTETVLPDGGGAGAPTTGRAGSTPVIRTLLLTDLVGSTSLLEELGDERGAEIVAQVDRVTRDAVARNDGVEIDKTDGYLLLFERPFNAIVCAFEIHATLEDMSRELGRPMLTRAGIHVGEVITWNNSPEDVARGAKPIEVEGLAKPMAARLMSLAAGGQTLLTQGAWTLAQRAAVGKEQDWGWMAHGPYRFQGVADPIEVFEVGPPGKDLVPPPSSAKVHRAGRDWSGLRRLGLASTFLALAGVTLASVYGLWDTYRDKVTYHLGIEVIDGVPVGVGHATPETALPWELTWRGGEVIRARRITQGGGPTDRISLPLEPIEMAVEVYVDGVDLTSSLLYPCPDPKSPMGHADYLALCEVEESYLEHPPSVAEYERSDEALTIRWLDGYGEIVRVDRITEEDGWFVRRSSDRLGRPQVGPYGMPVSATRRDADGRLEEVQFRNEDGVTPEIQSSPSTVYFVRGDRFGVRFERDAQGRIVRAVELGADRDPKDVFGVVTRQYAYNDPRHPSRPTRVDHLGSSGSPQRAPNNCVANDFSWDDHGNLLTQTCLDPEGVPMRDLEGCAIRTFSWSSDGWSETCNDPSGQPTASMHQFATIRGTFGESGLPDELRFESSTGDGAHNRLFARVAGVVGQTRFVGPSVVRATRDAQGSPERVGWFDGHNRPYASPEGWFAWLVERDDSGRRIGWKLLDDVGQPTSTTWGFSSVQITRDARGLPEAISLFDAAGQPALSSRGYHREELDNSDLSHRHEYRFFGTDGAPVIRSDGMHIIRMNTEDPYGRTEIRSAFGVDGGPVVDLHTGAHRRVWEHDGEFERFFDTEGKPTPGNDGCAVWQASLVDGHFVGRSCKDVEGNLVMTPRGSAAWQLTIKRGRTSSHTLFDQDNRPLWLQSYTYDAHGQRIAHQLESGSGQFVSRTLAEYDDLGHQTAIHHVDAEDRPVLSREGVATRRYGYDDRGNETSIAQFGLEGEPVIGTRFKYHRQEQHYDEAGRMISIGSFGLQGEPLADDEGIFEQHWHYDAKGRIGRMENLPVPGRDLPANTAQEIRRTYTASSYFASGQGVNSDGAPIDFVDPKRPVAMLSKFTIARDERDRPISLSNELADGAPALCPAGWARVDLEWGPRFLSAGKFTDGRGNAVRIARGIGWDMTYLTSRVIGPGEKSDPLPGSVVPPELLVGATGFESAFDMRGRLVELTLTGTAHKAVHLTQDFDARGMVARSTWRTLDGQPALNPDQGFARWEMEYDSRGELVRERWFAADESPSSGTRGYASHVILRDLYGNAIEESWLGENGEAAVDEAGCVVVRRTFSGKGVQTDQTCETK